MGLASHLSVNFVVRTLNPEVQGTDIESDASKRQSTGTS